MSAMLRSRVPPPASQRPAPPPARKTSDHENQVIPFHLDDGTDDNEEIRRRRYSSSVSSSSESDAVAARKEGIRGGHQSARRPQARSFNDQESEWEKVSNSNDRLSSEDDDDVDHHHDNATRKRGAISKAHDKPESPRRTGRKKTQQSESESDSSSESGEDEDDAEELRKASGSSATVTTASVPPPTSAPSTPRTLASTELASLSKLAVFPGSEHQLLQAHVCRVKTLLHSQYHFYINERLVLMAEKQPKSRTPNYYLFDMTRAASGLSSKLTKKSGNYIGKLRSSFNKKKSVLVGNQSRKTELAAMIFSGHVSSSEPRKVVVMLPPLNAKRQEIDGVAVGDDRDVFSVLVEHYKALKKGKQMSRNQHQVQVFENKQPVFENGFYRLNFHGRVSVPSVKNFQLVATTGSETASPGPVALVAKTAAGPAPTPTPATLLQPALRDDGPQVYLQFGKVDDNKFHLDFRSPITPIQAFGIALAQFNL